MRFLRSPRCCKVDDSVMTTGFYREGTEKNEAKPEDLSVNWFMYLFGGKGFAMFMKYSFILIEERPLFPLDKGMVSCSSIRSLYE